MPKKKAPQVPSRAPIHSKCCIGGLRETGLALVIVLRCDCSLCDIWFKSYEHFKIKMFLVEASYRLRTGLVQASYRRLEKRRRLCAFSHLGVNSSSRDKFQVLSSYRPTQIVLISTQASVLRFVYLSNSSNILIFPHA